MTNARILVSITQVAFFVDNPKNGILEVLPRKLRSGRYNVVIIRNERFLGEKTLVAGTYVKREYLPVESYCFT